MWAATTRAGLTIIARAYSSRAMRTARASSSRAMRTASRRCPTSLLELSLGAVCVLRLLGGRDRQRNALRESCCRVAPHRSGCGSNMRVLENLSAANAGRLRDDRALAEAWNDTRLRVGEQVASTADEVEHDKFRSNQWDHQSVVRLAFNALGNSSTHHSRDTSRELVVF